MRNNERHTGHRQTGGRRTNQRRAGRRPFLRAILAGAVLLAASPAWAGSYRVVYRFKGGSDGARRYAGLLAVRGVLFGTAFEGGDAGWGTVFSLTPANGRLVALHTFAGAPDDGARPYGGLISSGGFLYGATFSGGFRNSGSIYRISLLSGSYQLINNFFADGDGASPAASLLDFGGQLFGTTAQGGFLGVGTVFRLDPATNARTNVYSFVDIPDGAKPYAAFTNAGGMLYSTTTHGGAGPPLAQTNVLC